MDVATQRNTHVTEGIIETQEEGFVVLSPAEKRPIRRILHVNSYGGHYLWNKIKEGLIPAHQLLGCTDLVRKGYEIALAEPLVHFNACRRPIPHDLKLLQIAKSWLRRDDIIYCGHTLLYWLPLLKALRVLNRRIVSLTYAREHLDFSRVHDGILTLTPAAAAHAKKMAPQVKIAHLGWGVDLPFFPKLQYDPLWFLSCGIANRDFQTLAAAAGRCGLPVRVISPGPLSGLDWPKTVKLIDGGAGWLTDKTKTVSVRDLLTDHYPRSAGSLIILKSDPRQKTANGFTNMIEALAVGQPVVVTRTGALPEELDVEKSGCGLHVAVENPDALAEALKFLIENPKQAEAMGNAGRRLCETHYNMSRYADELHHFFYTL